MPNILLVINSQCERLVREPFNTELVNFLERTYSNVTLFFSADSTPLHDLSRFSHIILSGSRYRFSSDTDDAVPDIVCSNNRQILQYAVDAVHRPHVLGICFGMQMIATLFGGSVVAATTPHLGDSKYADYSFHESTLFGSGNWHRTYLVAKHFDVVDTIPPGFHSVGSIVSTGHDHVTALEHCTLPIFGVQFHLSPTSQGRDILRTFLGRGNIGYGRGSTTFSMLQCPKHSSK